MATAGSSATPPTGEAPPNGLSPPTESRNAVWARDGRELFFLDPSGRLNGARVRTAPGFASEPARPIGSMTYYRGDGSGQFDVPLDGRQFLMIKNLPDAKPPNNPILVLLNALPRGASR